MDEKKFQELMENEEFVNELLSKEEPEDAQKLFADNGVTMSIDEIKWMGALLAKSIDGEVDPEKILSFVKGEISEEDLSDDELKEVSGGVIGAATGAMSGVFGALAAAGGDIAAGAAAGAASAGAVSAGGLEAAGVAAAAAASTGVGIPIAIGIGAAAVVTAGVITVTRSWGTVGRGVSTAARSVGRAARSVGRALTSRW